MLVFIVEPSGYHTVSKCQLFWRFGGSFCFPQNGIALFFSAVSIKLQGVSGLDVYGSVHRSINLIERTSKMQLCSRIYYSNVS
jgi:hypothetical protein